MQQIKNSAEGDDELPDNPFSTRRPKDAAAGLSSGIKNAGKGALLGVASLIAAPIAGAQQEGAVGFAKGLVAGAIGAVALPLAGALTGVYQVGRGVFNTPEAIMENADGREWDPEKRVWYTYNLKEDAEKVLSISEEDYAKSLEEGSEGATTSTPSISPKHRVKDTELYDVLGVPTNATTKQIKMAYYKRAKQLHPDKNPNDPNANDKFQSVGAAYQVLSNPELRQKYDVHGKEGVEDAPIMDSSMFFTMVFGSDKFDRFVGEPWLAMLMSLGQDLDPDAPEDLAAALASQGKGMLAFKQKRREVQCAVHLAERLQPFVKAAAAAKAMLESMGDNPPASAEEESKTEQVFRTLLEDEAKELAASAFGGSLLGVIGYVYKEQALKTLGFSHSVAAGLGIESFKRRGHVFMTKYKVATSALKTYRVMKKAQRTMKQEEKARRKSAAAVGKDEGEDGAKKEENDQGTSEAMEQLALENMSVIVETLWNISVVDIESTLRSVCRKVLKDGSVSPDSRMLRAKGLLVMGSYFLELSTSSEDGLNEFTGKLVNEMQAAQNAAKIRKEQGKSSSNAQHQSQSSAQMPFGMTPPTPGDINMLTVMELKELLDKLGVDYSDCIEKADLVKKVVSLME